GRVMKQDPYSQRLEAFLHSDTISLGGFLAGDGRPLSEIIAGDLAVLDRLGYTAQEVASRMAAITELGLTGLGTTVVFEERLDVRVDDYQGRIICPFPHAASCLKRMTHVSCQGGGKTVFWSDLNIHLIEAHGFFEGRGAYFRLEPADLVRILF
ncbi:MAG TPA: hypothetical protein PLQ45_09760, partial [Anaerohalosphaeraceae bacterium]|nr:hypothetical protein [Anaerohalosphaeraceae bacterium]